MQNGAGVIHYSDWDNSYVSNILKEIYLDKVYQPYLGYFQDKVVLDLGCNISLFSQFAARYAKQVYAFEPAKATHDIAVKNLTDNNVKNVKLFQKAIAEEDGKATFHHSQNTTMNSLNPFVGNLPELKEEVETVRIDTFVKQEKIERIGFAKIDIEGTEHLFFNSEAFRNIVPILDSFIYEWHVWCGVDPKNINEALQDLGYSVKQIPSVAKIFGAVKTK